MHTDMYDGKPLPFSFLCEIQTQYPQPPPIHTYTQFEK